MTDRQFYTDLDGDQLSIRRANTQADALHLSITRSDLTGSAGLVLPTYELLAMIDLEHPDAMRGYLRERSDYLDSPHDRPSVAVAGNGPAAEHFDYLDAVPEADSPEDTDEQPDPIEQLRESGQQLGAAWRAFVEGVHSGRFGADR